jgi:CRP-like cAMP-binding protein
MTTLTHQAAKNALLRLMLPNDFALLQKDLEPVSLPLNKIIFETNQPISHVYFLESGIASVIIETTGKPGVEVGIYGREGMGGISVLLGVDRSPQKDFIQLDGSAYRIAVGPFNKALDKSPALHRLLLRYVHVFGLQTTLTAVANGTLVISQRLARWLVMYQDRADQSEFKITHAFLSTMLGVRRPGITEALHKFEDMGLIKTRPGRVKILDRAGLLKTAGPVYGVPEAEYARLFGPVPPD